MLGIAAKLFPDVRIFTFAIMSNHLHIVAATDKDKFMQMFDIFRLMLGRWLKRLGRPAALNEFCAKTRPVYSVEDMRNAIAYNNRNGYLVRSDCTPFSYQWSAGRYYFSPDSRRLAELESKLMPLRERRRVSHSRMADDIDGPLCFDGYALPLSFCDVSCGESIFRDAAHYFHKLSKSIESNATIAREIGSSVWYTDDELYTFVRKICHEKYNATIPTALRPEAKIELAHFLNHDYNASAKQIQRMLRIDPSILAAIGIK